MSQMFADQDFAPTDGIALGTELLGGLFLIQGCLQQGGFGIAYVARDSLDRQVVVKECFPAQMCKRVGRTVQPASAELAPQFNAIKKQFVREARQMAKLSHPNVLGVHQVFEENNTAYMALDHVEGMDLISLAEDMPERLTNTFLLQVLEQMLAAVAFIHDNGVLHRDISPDNILVDDQDNLTLIDFGAAQEHSLPGAAQLPSIIAVKDGYSPHEFYSPNNKHNCASDMYSLGATLYYLITGYPPECSHDRLCAISNGDADPYEPLVQQDWGYDYNILATVDQSLSLLQESRYQSAADWKAALQKFPTKRPKKLAKPVFDPMLEDKISQLVASTNTELAPNVTKTATARKTVSQDSPKQPNQKTVVDIFGNPIEDLDAWQAEQEREIEAWHASRRAAEEARKAQIRPPDPPKKSFISSLISRCLPGRSAPSGHGQNPEETQK